MLMLLSLTYKLVKLHENNQVCNSSCKHCGQCSSFQTEELVARKRTAFLQLICGYLYLLHFSNCACKSYRYSKPLIGVISIYRVATMYGCTEMYGYVRISKKVSKNVRIVRIFFCMYGNVRISCRLTTFFLISRTFSESYKISWSNSINLN